MIPFIRSLSELMAITEYKDRPSDLNKDYKHYSSTVDSGQRKRYIRSLEEKEVVLPNLPRTIGRQLRDKKELISSFIDNLDYNDQIQSSYDLTLLERQNNRNHQDAA